jgi:transcriptional regulator with XRE-family HTH domain
MERKLMAAVASAIRHFRQARGMSQEDLAGEAGLDRTYISGVECGVRNITLDSLELIILALSVKMKLFFSIVTEEIDISNTK